MNKSGTHTPAVWNLFLLMTTRRCSDALGFSASQPPPDALVKLLDLIQPWNSQVAWRDMLFAGWMKSMDLPGNQIDG